jgi:hypothetical protein
MNREMSSLAKRKETIRHPEKDSANRLVHWDSLKELLCTNLVCKTCGADVHIGEMTNSSSFQSTKLVMTWDGINKVREPSAIPPAGMDLYLVLKPKKYYNSK